MKKLFLSLISLFAFSGQVLAQQPDTARSAVKVGNGSDNQKTMNRQQTITNYIEAEAKNLTSTSKGVQLQATIFALNPKDSAKKYRDDYYLKNTWQRYTQWTIGGGTDKNSKINAFNVGLSYDVLKKNDLTLLNIYKETAKQYGTFSPVTDKINVIRDKVLSDYVNSTTNNIEVKLKNIVKGPYGAADTSNLKANLLDVASPDAQQKALGRDSMFNVLLSRLKTAWKAGNPDPAVHVLAGYSAYKGYGIPMTSALKDYVFYAAQNGKAQKAPTTDGLDTADFNDLVKEINSGIKAQSGDLHGNNIVEVYTYLDTLYKQETNYLAGRASIVTGYNFMHAATGISTQHAFSVVYLKGIGGPTSRRLWELTVTAADTVATDTVNKSKPLSRNIGTFQVGINRVLFTDAKSVSLLELNFAGELDHVFLDKYAKEQENKEYATLTLQGRPSAKSVWFKLAVKYGGKSNFLGFLDVTLSLDNSSAKSSNN